MKHILEKRDESFYLILFQINSDHKAVNHFLVIFIRYDVNFFLFDIFLLFYDLKRKYFTKMMTCNLQHTWRLSKTFEIRDIKEFFIQKNCAKSWMMKIWTKGDKKLDKLEAEKLLKCGKSHNFGNIALIIWLKGKRSWRIKENNMMHHITKVFMRDFIWFLVMILFTYRKSTTPYRKPSNITNSFTHRQSQNDVSIIVRL